MSTQRERYVSLEDLPAWADAQPLDEAECAALADVLAWCAPAVPAQVPNAEWTAWESPSHLLSTVTLGEIRGHQ